MPRKKSDAAQVESTEPELVPTEKGAPVAKGGAIKGGGVGGRTPDAPDAPEVAVVTAPRRHLRNISEIRTFFRTNEPPIYFVGPTAFNLLGIDRWVRNFRYIVYYDSWDGSTRGCSRRRRSTTSRSTSGEEINNYLLRDPEVQAHMTLKSAVWGSADDRDGVLRRGDRGDLRGAGLRPDPAAAESLRRRLDSKIVTTRLGNEAGAAVGAQRARRRSLVDRAQHEARRDGRLGTDLVVQTPYGDSGKTTFFIGRPRRLGRAPPTSSVKSSR